MTLDSIYENKPDLSLNDITNIIKNNIDNFDDLDNKLPSTGQIVEIKDIPVNDSFKNESIFRYSHSDFKEYIGQAILSLPDSIILRWQLNIEHVRNGIQYLYYLDTNESNKLSLYFYTYTTNPYTDTQTLSISVLQELDYDLSKIPTNKIQEIVGQLNEALEEGKLKLKENELNTSYELISDNTVVSTIIDKLNLFINNSKLNEKIEDLKSVVNDLVSRLPNRRN